MKLEGLKPHRPWLAVGGCAVLMLLAGPPLTQLGQDAATRRAEAIATERAELQKSAERFQEDMRLAQRTDGQMDAGAIDRLLAPVDRLRVAAELEQQAALARFTHFTYTLTPEKKARVDVIDDNTLAESDVTVAADMPLDTDADTFLTNLRSALPGRVHLRRLTLTRLAPDAALSLGNIHIEAVLDWLSNGAAKEKAVP